MPFPTRACDRWRIEVQPRSECVRPPNRLSMSSRGCQAMVRKPCCSAFKCYETQSPLGLPLTTPCSGADATALYTRARLPLRSGCVEELSARARGVAGVRCLSRRMLACVISHSRRRGCSGHGLLRVDARASRVAARCLCCGVAPPRDSRTDVGRRDQKHAVNFGGRGDEFVRRRTAWLGRR